MVNKQMANVVVKIGANSKEFKRELRGIDSEVDKSSKKMAKRAKIAAAGIAAGAAGAAVAFNEFRKFERDFTNVITLLDEASFKTKEFAQGIDDLKDGVKSISRETGDSFENLNKGLFDLVSAGVDAEKAIDTLRISSQLAISGATNTSVAVDGITSALNAYGLAAEEAQNVSDQFFTAQKFGKTTIEELAQGFGTVAPLASSLGVSMEELLAATSAATTAGISTNRVYTGLKAVFANVQKPTQDAANEAERLGIEFNSTALRAQGLDGFLKSVTESAGFNQTSLEKLFGSVEALNTVTALAGQQNENFTATLAELSDKQAIAKTNADAFAVANNTADQKIKQATQSVKVAATSLGEFLAPAVIFASEQVVNLVDGIEDLKTIISGLARIFAESFNAILATTRRWSAQTTLAISDVLESFGELLDRLPGVEGAFGDTVDRMREKAFELAMDANERRARAEDFFGTPDPETTRERFDREADILRDHFENLEDIKREAKEREKEEGLDDPVTGTDEEFDGFIDNLRKRLEQIQEAREGFADKEIETALNVLANKKQFKKEEVDLANKVLKEKSKINSQEVFDTIGAYAEMFNAGKGFTKALFLVSKAASFAETIVNTNKAYVAALAHPPGPPTTVPVANAVRVSGYLSAATIAATAIKGISAQEGGVVPGGFGGGDRVPALLEPGEIITPSKFNPLSPNFEETFGGLGGAQRIQLDLTERASQFITVNQREDTALGIQR